jgi:hypothetical protein
VTPFGLPQSNRLLDPSQAKDATLGFTQIDPTTGQAPATQYSNVMANFDNEYVWHCHILGHEEQDFMRPFIFHPTVTVPDAPAGVTVVGSKVSWTDTTPFGGQDSDGVPTAGSNAANPEPTSSPKNEIGFKVIAADGKLLATVPANVTSWTDTTGQANLANVTVVAYNAKGSAAGIAGAGTTYTGTITTTAATTTYTSTGATQQAGTAGPTGLTQTRNADGSVTLSWAPIAGATSYQVSVNGGPSIKVEGATTLTVSSGLIPGVNTFTVTADTLSGTTAAAIASLYNGVAYAPVALAASQGNQNNGSPRGSITLSWANDPKNVNNVTGLRLSWTQQPGGPATNGSITFAPTVTGTSVINLNRDRNYNFTLTALTNIGNSLPVSVRGLSSP